MISGTCKSLEHASAILSSNLRDKLGSVLSSLVMIYFRTDVQMFSDNMVDDWKRLLLLCCVQIFKMTKTTALMNSRLYSRLGGNFIDHL